MTAVLACGCASDAATLRRTVPGHAGTRVCVADSRKWMPRLDELRALLEPDEQARVDRMRFACDRDALTVAYALHRVELAGTLGVAPAAVPLRRDALGRPRVADDEVWTSLSHAGPWLAIAVDGASPVGVDIEPLSRIGAMAEVAGSLLHPDEYAWSDDGVDEARAHRLLALWVCKEAVLKAAGMGLRMAMSSFPIQADGTARVPGFDRLWRVRTLAVDASVALAVATGDARDVHCRVIDPSPGRDAGIA